MAAIIDGSSHPGYFKLTPDDGAATAYFLVPKHSVHFQSSDATSGSIRALGNADLIFSTGASTEDENGNALDTSAKVARYLADNKSF